MQWAKLIPILMLLAAVSGVNAACTGQVGEQYPGWEARFNGSVGVGGTIKNDVNGTVGMKDLSLEVLKILNGEIVNVRVAKKGAFEEDFSITKSTKNFDIALADIRAKVVDVTATTANITIYTHDQAILNATTNVTYETSDQNATLPGEVVEIESEIKNIGEIGAEDLVLTEDFGDFELVTREVTMPNSFCPNSTFTAKYRLKAPSNIREDTNYTLHLRFTYSDYNAQLDLSNTHTMEIPITISVRPARLKITKSGGNWTLLNQGREVTIFNIIENLGNTTAFNVKLVDTPPSDFEIVSGQPSLNLGRLDPGDKKTRSYTVISNDPISCTSSSKVTYEDELGNNYTAYSKRAETRFSPFVTITKTIKDAPIANLSYGYPIKTRRSMKSDYSDIKPAAVTFTADAVMKTFEGEAYYALCQGAFLNGTSDICIGDGGSVLDNNGEEPKVVLNRTSEITVEIKNVGNTIARDIVSHEILENIDYNGTTSWSGSLMPGETASYSYVAQPVKRGIDITTEVYYPDIDPLSLSDPEIEGAAVGVCSKKLRNVSFTSSGNFTFTSPDLRIEQPEEIKVYEDSPFDFLPIIYNNGTEKIYDIEISYDFGGLTLIKGQSTNKIDELGRGFKPFKESTCNIGEWNNENITRTYRFTDIAAGAGEKEIIYEVKDGKLKVYVNGASTSVKKKDCEDDGLKIEHDVTLYQRFPFHVPPEPESTGKNTKKVTYKIYGNPAQQDLAFWTPDVEDQTYIPLTTTVTYEDFYGNRYERRFTTDVFVVPAGAAFSIVRAEKTDLGVVINYTNVTELAEPGELNIELTSRGYAPIDKYTLNLSLPSGVEVATNDSNWTGRIEAQIKRQNDTLYVFSGTVSREGNISRGGKELLPLTIKGVRAGTYDIPYRIEYDGKELEGSFRFKVRGPVLSATKELSSTSVEKGGTVTVTVTVKNTGEGNATNVVVSDGVPSSMSILSGKTQLTADVLEPDDELTLTYTVKATASSNMGGTKVSWQDALGNSYTGDLEPISLTVIKPKPGAKVTETPAPKTGPGRIFPQEIVVEKEGIELSSREGIAAIALTLVVMAIIFKLVTLRVPVKEEEE